MHDGLDLGAEVVEEFLFFLLWGGDHGGGFLLTLAFLLKFADLVEGAVEDAGGLRPCSLDGTDLLFLSEVQERVNCRVCGDVTVYKVAAAHAPGGAGDLGGEMFFNHIDGFEGLVHVGDEEVVDFLFAGLNKIGLGVKADGDGIAAGVEESFGGARSGGLSRVTAVGVDLCFGGHG